jgi:hypothetical protein
MDVVKPLDATADWYAELAERDCARELQAFYDANPEYWKLTHGHGPQPNAAEEGFDVQPPADMTYTSLPDWLIRLRGSDRIVGQVAVATDLMAAGVTHLGFFMIETARHASGFGDELYAAYERWAIDRAGCVSAWSSATSEHSDSGSATAISRCAGVETMR